MRRTLTILALAGILASLPQVAQAGPEDRDHHVTQKLNLELEDTNGFVKGFIADWAPDGSTEPDRTQFRLFVNPDDVGAEEGTRSELSTEEWSVELMTGSCAEPGELLTRQFFINSRVYGPSMNLFVLPAMLEQAGSVVTVHDGPSETDHAIAAGFSGRHEVSCVPI